MNTQIEITERQVQLAMSAFCPFGYLDIASAIRTSLDAGKDIDFVYEQVNEFSISTDTRIEDCDPNYCVYDAILNEARYEIEQLIGYDFINDGEGSIYTAGNFMATSYDYNTSDVELLEQKLKENNISFEQLSQTTQFFINQLEINL